MKNRIYRTSAQKIKAGMEEEVSNEVIKVAKQHKTKILIIDKNGKPKKVSPKQMEKIIKDNKNNS